MPKPFHELTLEEFADLVQQFNFTRKIEAVHMHHTWRPNHSDFNSRPPLASIEGMFNHHTKVNGWSDIAQHVTIDPRGKIWTGRNWNRPPASAGGHNGSSVSGPFMFEIIGDFDHGKDPFAGEQRNSVIGVIVSLLRRFDLSSSAVRFHNQMSAKSCPGSALKRPDFLQEITQALESLPRAFSTDTEAENAMRQRTLSIIANWDADPSVRSFEGSSGLEEPGEETMNANDVSIAIGAVSPAAHVTNRAFGRGIEFTPEEKQLLRQHVINLRLGEFSEGGIFQTSKADVERIFQELLPDELEVCKREGRPLHLVFYAHGGLISEEEGLRPILRRLPFWRQNGMYPIFFCWETGLKETVSDLIKGFFTGRRDLISDASDAVLEALASVPGREVWGQIKRSAEIASIPGSGAHTVAEMTQDFWANHHAELRIHAVGHSAGAVFHTHFLPVLLGQKKRNDIPLINVRTLQFLAPACTTELFKEKLLPLIGSKKQILSHTLFTMHKDFELADTAGPYQKSLLYFVSRAFEERKPTPILGLEESLRDDPDLIRFYGLARTIPGTGKILFSKTPADAPPDSATASTTHGDFDNEAKTMNSVARRILEKPDGSIVSFVDETSQNEVTRALTTTPEPTNLVSRTGGTAKPELLVNRMALCIGIDSYPAPHNLEGCVNDARDWAGYFTSQGFSVKTLLNQQATRGAILLEINQVITQAKSGDVVAIQFSGHGTEVTDFDGDETSGKDQALVPVDFASGSYLIDDDLRAITGKIQPGVNVTFFMDCCHSGSNTRLFGAISANPVENSRPRFMKLTAEMEESHRSFRSVIQPGQVPPNRSPDEMREVNFAACRADQVAFESNGSGDFTRNAMQILKSGRQGLTNGAFRQRVIDAFGSSRRQDPILDAAPVSVEKILLEPLQNSTKSAVDHTILQRLAELELKVAGLGKG